MEARGVDDPTQEQGRSKPLLVRGELEHPERRIVALQVRRCGNQAHHGRRSEMGDERSAPQLGGAPSDAVHDQQDERKDARGLDEGADG
jgi:hypothetical protein